MATDRGGRSVDTGGMFSSVDDVLPPLALVTFSSTYRGDDVSEDDVTRWVGLGEAAVMAAAVVVGWSREWKNRSTSLDFSKGPL